MLRADSVCMLAQEQPRRSVFKVIGIIPTDQFNDERITNMDKDRVAGVGHQVKGAVKEVAGEVTGDTKTEAEGKAEKAAGKVQNTIGGVKDSLRGK
jgi:uncharacterized protein YjbJ (UPF0337 family)